MCIEEGRILTYQEYQYSYKGSSRYMLTRETVDEMKTGFLELNRQYGANFLTTDWAAYGEELKVEYEKAPELF